MGAAFLSIVPPPFRMIVSTWNNNLVDCIVGTYAWNGTDRYNAGCK